MEEIPPELILNWDQTGLNLVPASTWTMEQKGKKRVEIKGLNDKRQITGVFCGNLLGDFLPIQLVYGGKTSRCHPVYSFPSDWDITHSENHWSNETTMLAYIKNVIVPFVERVRDDRCSKDCPALAIFDHFKGQLTDNVCGLLEQHNIHSVLVPANCTDRLQPLDLSVNRSAKAFLQSQFQNWYASELKKQIDTVCDIDDLEPIDLTTAKMKCISAQWITKLYEYLCKNPEIIVNGFLAAGISQALDASESDEIIDLDSESDYDSDGDYSSYVSASEVSDNDEIEQF